MSKRNKPESGRFDAFGLRPRTWLMAGVLAAMSFGVILGGSTLGGADEVPEEITFFRIGTGATSGTYFPIGGLIASAISNPPGSRDCDSGGSCGVPGLIAVAQSTEGSVENVEAIAAGELDSALSQADVSYWAFTGMKMFERASDKEAPVGAKLRAIANLFPESMHLVVRRDSAIKNVVDLKGKRISLGEPESGTLASVTLILQGYGLTESKLVSFFLTPGQAADKLRAGEIDAFFLVAGSPVAAISDLARLTPIRLIPLAGERADEIREKEPFFAITVIPENTYEGVGETETLSVGAQWLVSADVPEDLVYGITRALWHSSVRKLLESGHPKGRLIRMETALNGLGVPLHPGAERFYLEEDLIHLGIDQP